MEKETVKILVNQVFGEPTIYNGTSQKTGNAYTIKTFNCFGTVNGNQQNFSLKGFGDDANLIVAGFSGDATVENFNGQLSYQIKSERKSGGSSWGSKKVTYTLQELDELFSYALIKVKSMVSSLGEVPIDSVCRLVSTYMERATYSGVKLKPLNEQEPQQPQNQTTQAMNQTAQNLSGPAGAVQQTMQGTVTNETVIDGFVDTGYGDKMNNDDVPF